ncbi:Tuberculostearic acid methyltransferase UfaA1 [Dichanthelium oligosanthes]|uniref:Tuberculostearic acid methyltransferase UfaA1 n=1 Tax=Dichanthelium oligosanthes TaxID=888268 RepID=A0A1E5VY60_9POAL|nr:Tuberculostearic acid methyltransferase UfaA1 [Dichanthelium oligosanthes]
MRVAVVGAGLSGLAAAHELARSGGVRVTVYEKEDDLGGRGNKTMAVDDGTGRVVVDLGCMVFNQMTCPNLMKWLEGLGVEVETSDMSFSASTRLDRGGGGFEWGSRNGISGVLVQKSNLLSPRFWLVIREIFKFKNHALEYLEDHGRNYPDRNETLGQFIQSHRYSQLFQDAYLIDVKAVDQTMGMAISGLPIQSTQKEEIFFELFTTVTYCKLPYLFTHEKNVTLLETGYRILEADGSEEIYDRIIFGLHAPDALKVLGAEATHKELRVLGAFQYIYSDVYFHCDESLMPQNFSAWSARNFLWTTSSGACVTYWLNILQLLSFYCLTIYMSHVGIQIICANRGERKRLSSSVSKSNYIRKGWWTPLIGIKGVAFARYILRHASRKNSVSKAAKNISMHYDLSNDFFALYLDPSMTYSSAIFKAKVEPGHHVLDIGSGWGTLAIQLVKKIGCKYTGITLSEEQLKYSKRKVKEAGLEDQITFLLCDYRQIPTCHKFDRIISCEMIEHVGHEYMDDFFASCEYHLAEHGLLVLQFISIPEELYDKMRRRPEFMKEYIFPGGCLPSLARVVSAMSNASRLCIQHVENIGDHYSPTLIHWRDNFMANRKKVSALGFDEKFIRTWEYYLTYAAALFKSRTLMDYQIVFSRPVDAKLPSYLTIA